MGNGQGQEAPLSQLSSSEQDMPVTIPRKLLITDGSQTQPGEMADYPTSSVDANADTQPIGHSQLTPLPEWPVARPTHQRPNTVGMGFCLSVATSGIVAIVLIAALAAGTLYLTHGGNLTSLGGPDGLGELTGASASPTTKPAPTVKPTATHDASGPAAPTTQPQSPPTGKPTATPKPENPPPAPRLSASPQQASGNCLLGNYPSLTVKNSGGGSLSWSARTSDGLVHASPSSGTLRASQTKTVSLSGIHVGKTLTVTFSGNGGDATITINCG